MEIACRILICFLLAFAGSSNTSGQAPDSNEDCLLCGMECVYVAVNSLLDEPITYDSIRKEFGAPSADGFSLEKLKEVVESHGLAASTFRSNIVDLKSINEPFVAIAHMSRGHFVVAIQEDNGSIKVVDPYTAHERKITQSELSGYVLLVSKNKIDFSSDYSLTPLYVIGFGLLVCIFWFVWQRRSAQSLLVLLIFMYGCAQR